jgi:hypothetical protein
MFNNIVNATKVKNKKLLCKYFGKYFLENFGKNSNYIIFATPKQKCLNYETV